MQEVEEFQLVLGEIIDPREINSRFEAIVEKEKANKFNIDFKAAEDPMIIEMSKGVHMSQVFEIENSILKPIVNVHN